MAHTRTPSRSTVVVALVGLGWTGWIAALLVVSSAIGAIVVVGLLEGAARIPDVVSPSAGIAVFLAGLALSGRVAVDVDVDPEPALRAVSGAALVIMAGGLVAAQATESQGEALEPVTVMAFAIGLLTLLGASALTTRQLRRPKTEPDDR